FTSDNGPWRNLPPRMVDSEPVEPWHAGTTGALSGAKATSLEGGSRVPAIVSWPGKIPPNQVTAGLATTMDLHATILDITDTPLPEKPLDGTSLWEFWTQQTSSPRTYFHYFTGRRLDGVRDGEWKLRIAPPADGWTSPELATGDGAAETTLYNLKNDPYEQFNLADQYPEEVERLRKKMEDF
ncbi:MAG: sulfatase/phosphatase domain-containing protein, partial [Bacteroidota bacterium]